MTTRDQEDRQLSAALRAIGADPTTWIVLEPERQRPDYVVSTPHGIVGLEMTEILLGDQGEHRAGERRLREEIRELVQQFLVAQGGTGGGSIDGNVQDLASGPHRLSMPRILEGLRRHLAVNGAGLANDRGVMAVPFRYELGQISRVHRVDGHDELRVYYDHSGNLPAYKQPRDQSEIEVVANAMIKKKVQLASEYQRDWPLWLALRNPNQRLTAVSESCINEACAINGTCFARIFIYNDPEDVLDARPPEPQFHDLIPWRPHAGS